MKKKVNKKHHNNGIILPAGMFLGIGIGLLTGKVAAFTLIGIALGFLGMWLANRH